MIRSMTSSPLAALTFVLLLLAGAPPAAYAGDDNEKQQQPQCGLYLAVSSTTSDGKDDKLTWGVFAGKDYGRGEVIGSPDIAVNAINLRANNLLDEQHHSEEEQDRLIRTIEFIEESFWVPDSAGGKFEIGEGQRIITAISGPGFLGAYNPSLTNADWDHENTYKRPSIGERPGDSHPGRGAVTPFYNTFLRSMHDVKAGSEVMINYGSNYEEEMKKEDLHRADYARIDETVEQMIAFFDKHRGELDDESKMEIYKFIVGDVMNAAVGMKKARKITSMLPENPDELVEVKVAGGTLAYSQPAAFRTLAWLEENGRCLDNIRAGPSMIPDAGRGAFATRAIKKGSVVTPAPLLHIPNGEVMNMHPLYYTEHGDWARESDEVVGRQLLVNYCYGHPSSSMLFYPVGSGAGLINHPPAGRAANAKLAWSDHPSHRRDWFDVDPLDLLDEDHSYLGLMMEVVATEDIEEGQEIFIDYGKEWSEGTFFLLLLLSLFRSSGKTRRVFPCFPIQLIYRRTNLIHTASSFLLAITSLGGLR